MISEDRIYSAITTIYDAVLDHSLWPEALEELGDIMATSHIGISAMNWTAEDYESIWPRTDPYWRAQYKKYWAFDNPIWTGLMKLPANVTHVLETHIPYDEFRSTPIYNEWYRPAGIGLAMMGARLQMSDSVTALFGVANATGDDHLQSEQVQIFDTVMPHVARAIMITNELHVPKCVSDITPEMLEKKGAGIVLVDSCAKVLYANSWARAMITPGCGLALRGGCLESTDRKESLRRLITFCAKSKATLPCGLGGEMVLRRNKRQPLRVTVTPLRAYGTAFELPWLSLQRPVALITICEFAKSKRIN
ncbi:MAG TPA: hypothetical protein VEK34_13615 [Methylocella sp.]|nr:hypothetical protein [Methylocella sp.]